VSSVILGAAFAIVEVLSSSPCNDSAEIEQRIQSLLSTSASQSDRASVTDADDALRVELHDAAGALIGRRTLPRAGTCEERAEAVAVVIAAWESDLRRYADTAPARTVPIAESTVIVAAIPRSSALTWDVSAAFLGTIAGGAFAAGASADVTLGKRGFPLAARIGVAGADSRDVTLGGGHTSWTRAALLLGPVLDIVSKRGVRFDLHADAALGWMYAQGRGYNESYSSSAFDPALGGGARLAITRWKIEPWLDCTLLGWLRHQTLSVTEASGTASSELPRFDVWLRAGFAYGKR
jgi:hypothetical protein